MSPVDVLLWSLAVIVGYVAALLVAGLVLTVVVLVVVLRGAKAGDFEVKFGGELR